MSKHCLLAFALALVACSGVKSQTTAVPHENSSEPSPSPPVAHVLNVEVEGLMVQLYASGTLLWERPFKANNHPQAQLAPGGEAVLVLTDYQGNSTARWLSVETGEVRATQELPRSDWRFLSDGRVFLVRRTSERLLVSSMTPEGESGTPLLSIPIIQGARGGGPELREVESYRLSIERSQTRPEVAVLDAAGRFCLLNFSQVVTFKCHALRNPDGLMYRDGFEVSLQGGGRFRLDAAGQPEAIPPPATRLSRRLNWGQRLHEPVRKMTARGNQAWALAGLEQEVGGFQPGGLFHLDIASVSEWPFRNSRSTVGSPLSFYASVSGPRALMVTNLCCGESSLEIYRWQGKTLQADSLGSGFMPHFQLVAEGSPALLCTDSEPWQCIYENHGKVLRTPSQQGAPRVHLLGPTIEGLCALKSSSLGVIGLRGQEVLQIRDRVVEAIAHAPEPCGDPWRAAVNQLDATDEGTLWLILNGKVRRQTSGGWEQSQPPVGQVADLRAIKDHEVWAVGTLGAAHFDGTRWSREAGVLGSLHTVRAASPETIWMAGAHGVWLGQTARNAKLAVASRARSHETSRLTAITELPFAQLPSMNGLQTREHTLPRRQGEQRSGARGILRAPEGGWWLWGDEGLFHWQGDDLRVLESERLHPVTGCGRCIATQPNGRMLDLRHRIVRELSSTGRARTLVQSVPEPVAVASRPSGETWVVGASADDALPHILRNTGKGFTPLVGIPPVTYADVSLPEARGAWLVGGLSGVKAGGRVWPTSFGVISRWIEKTETLHSYQVPAAALLAVSALSESVAWAVGYDGLIVRIDGERSDVWKVQGAPGDAGAHPWLHAVLARSPEDVWFAGEGGVLVHYDGTRFERVALPVTSTTTGIGYLDGPWLVGPSHVLEVRRLLPPQGH